MAEAAVVAPRLRFSLPGEWIVLDPRDEAASLAAIDAAVQQTVGAADDAALLRRRMRDELTGALARVQDAEAEALYICQGLGGMPLPIALLVHFPQDLRMSPAVGTSAESVIGVLRKSFEQLAVSGIEEAEEIELTGSRALRLVQIDEQTVEAEDVSRDQRRISANYWYALPGTKNIVLVNLSTPLGDIPHLMLDFFDNIVRASYFEMPSTPDGSAGEGVAVEETAGAASGA